MSRNGLMKTIELLGNRLHWKCQMCGKSMHKGIAYKWNSPAFWLTKADPLTICVKCARRENGSKNKKGWDKIHENS